MHERTDIGYRMGKSQSQRIGCISLFDMQLSLLLLNGDFPFHEHKHTILINIFYYTLSPNLQVPFISKNLHSSVLYLTLKLSTLFLLNIFGVLMLSSLLVLSLEESRENFLLLKSLGKKPSSKTVKSKGSIF